MRKCASFALVFAVLAAFVCGGAVAEGSGYQQSFLDPTEYPDFPEIDIISLSSYEDGTDIVVVLTVNGSLASDADHSYNINVGGQSFDEDGYIAYCYYCDGDGDCTAYSPDDVVELDNDCWSVSGSSLTFRLPLEYAGPADDFNISGSATYSPVGSYDMYVNDWVNIGWGYYDYGYDLTDASPLSLPGTAGGALDDLGKDLYSVELSEGDGLGAFLSAERAERFYLTLLDDSGAYVGGVSYATYNSSISYIAPEGGTYYIAVEYWGWEEGAAWYNLTAFLRGQSGEAFERSEPESLPWTTWDVWSAGGYIEAEDLFEELYSSMDASYYEDVEIQSSGDGGIGDYVTIEYAGVEGGYYRFDYKGRIYADVAVEMTATYSAGEEYGSLYGEDGSVEMKADIDGMADLSYSGSIWLGYYSDGGVGYYAIERQAYEAEGLLDVEMTAETSMSGDYFSYSYTMRVEVNGTVGLELDISHSPGMPFLPEAGDDISVEKRVTTTYDGEGFAHIDTNFDMSGMGEDMDEDSPYDFDGAMNGSYQTFYSLSYDSGTGEASAPPAITDPLIYLQAIASAGYAGEYYSEPMPLTGDYWTAGADFDGETGFYTGFELPLGPLGTALDMQEGGESGPLSGLDLGGAGMTMGRVGQGEARSFIDDPAGFIDSRSSPSIPAWIIYVGIGAALGSAATGVAVVLSRRKGESHNRNPPEQMPPAP